MQDTIALLLVVSVVVIGGGDGDTGCISGCFRDRWSVGGCGGGGSCRGCGWVVNDMEGGGGTSGCFLDSERPGVPN